jgi:hypothetical protein
MSNVDILRAATREFPLASTPAEVREKCKELDIDLIEDQIKGGALHGAIPTGHTYFFEIYPHVAFLRFCFDDVPALKGFEVERGAATP